jgi:hypothetical protein
MRGKGNEHTVFCMTTFLGARRCPVEVQSILSHWYGDLPVLSASDQPRKERCGQQPLPAPAPAETSK